MNTELRVVPEDIDGGKFAICSTESERRSPEGGRGRHKRSGRPLQGHILPKDSVELWSLHGDTGEAYFIS